MQKNLELVWCRQRTVSNVLNGKTRNEDLIRTVGTPVLGGWSLGLNRYGKNTKDAENFLLWACGDQNQILLPLLGGSTLRKEFYISSDLENLQPWKSLILESYRQSRRREMPEILDESRWKNNIYTTLISKEIVRVMDGEISEEEAVKQMEENIKKLVAR